MTLKRMPFISSVQLAVVDGSSVIPTTLFYKEKRPISGRQAIEIAPSPEYIVEDFKIELGKTDPDIPTRRSSSAENTPRRTAAGLTKDFLDETLLKIGQYLNVKGLALPKKILIAEPLSLGGRDLADEAWLSNYRKAIRKSLHGRFEQIDFMPEPFAVFQYYRYGLRHPLVAEQRKHVALVLDFGGGTFDVSVVETTKAGELSGGGANSRPLAAKSVQVGGFFINRLIAEDLLFSSAERHVEKGRLRNDLAFFYEHRNDGEDFLEKLGIIERSFFINMKELLQNVEQGKVAICRSIANWSLSADLSGVTPFLISVPTDPYKRDSRQAAARLDASKVFSIYTSRVWADRLKATILATIVRAKDDLGGQSISVVLLSGGSSNIRWLKPLLERDLKSHIEHAQIVELNENFQEIVAKGLATECARRHYTGGQGDFRAVTYNRLCLLIQPDDGDVEFKQFKPASEALVHGTDELDNNVLLPSASSLRGLIGQRLQWRVKPNKLPRRSLSYYFMRSSFDAQDLDARHNIVDTKVLTPSSTQHQQNMVVELIVREDGTAEPYFRYGHNNVREGTVVAGRPFYMDSTYFTEEIIGDTYLGFDFGTSTSSCSYVSSSDIQWIEQRARSVEWLELGELVADLPYPAAAALARYMSEMDLHRRAERGRSALEALLTLAAYVTLAELSASPKPSSALFKGLAHRSAGPLWGLLKQAIPLCRGKDFLAFRLTPLTQQSNQFDSWISEIASAKHDRVSAVDYVTMLATVGNHVSKMLEGWHFGVFEGVTQKRFSAGKFQGIFRVLKGASRSFIDVYQYEGGESFPSEDIFLINVDLGAAICLSPLYLIGLQSANIAGEEVDIFEFDNVRKAAFEYRSVHSGSSVGVEENGQYGEIWSFLTMMREREQPRPITENLHFKTWNEAAKV